jgi:hypothetical protein
MNDIEKRSYDMLVRVRDFGATRAADFPPAGLGGQMFAEVAGVVTELEHHATVQTTNAARVGSVSKATAREILREDLRSINRTARAMAVDDAGLKKKFGLPRAGDQSLLNGARAIAERAEPLVAEFTKHELAPDFLVNLKKNIDAFQAAVTEQNHTKDARVQATASLESVLSRGVKAMQRLDAIVKNKYRKDSPTLSAWESASHLERNNGRSKAQAKPDEAKPDPSKASASGGLSVG